MNNKTSHDFPADISGAHAIPEENTTDQIETLNSQNSVPENAAQNGANANAPSDETANQELQVLWEGCRQVLMYLLTTPYETVRAQFPPAEFPGLFEDEELEDEERVR